MMSKFQIQTFPFSYENCLYLSHKSNQNGFKQQLRIQMTERPCSFIWALLHFPKMATKNGSFNILTDGPQLLRLRIEEFMRPRSTF